MRPYLLIFLIASLLAACGNVPTAKAKTPWFNARAFAGLVSAPAVGKSARLDFALDGPNGTEAKFSDCAQVQSARIDDVIESQQALLDNLKINCEAYGRFSQAQAARRSFLPDALSEAFIKQLPESILPSIAGGNGAKPGTVIGQSAFVETIDAATGERTEILTRIDHVAITRMAQADIDHDGVEDMLIAIGWRTRGAFGRGVSLVQISRTGPDAPVTLTGWQRP